MASLVAYSEAAGLFRSKPDDDRRANALIDIDGVLDFTTSQALQFENASGAASSAAKWLGGAYEQVPARWKEASAATYVGPTSPPTLIISSGNAHFTAGKDQVIATLQANHIPVRWYAFEKARTMSGCSSHGCRRWSTRSIISLKICLNRYESQALAALPSPR
jgi:hypothetical protein